LRVAAAKVTFAEFFILRTGNYNSKRAVLSTKSASNAPIFVDYHHSSMFIPAYGFGRADSPAVSILALIADHGKMVNMLGARIDFEQRVTGIVGVKGPFGTRQLAQPAAGAQVKIGFYKHWQYFLACCGIVQVPKSKQTAEHMQAVCLLYVSQYPGLIYKL